VFLPVPLDGRIILTAVEDLDVVSRINSHPVSELVGLIECLADASPVIEEEPSLVHELHGTLCQGGTPLCPGVHQSQLISICDILNGNCAIDGVIILGDVENGGEIPGVSMIQDSLLHLEAIRVGVECAVVGDVRGVELDYHLFALGCQGDRAEFQGPFRKRTSLEASEDEASSLILRVVIVERDLVDYGRLIYGAALELRVPDIFTGAIIHSEDVRTTALLVIISEPGPVPQVSIEVKALILALLGNRQVMAVRVIIAVESDILEISGEVEGLCEDTLDIER
jgi:hypothetical protein